MLADSQVATRLPAKDLGRAERVAGKERVEAVAHLGQERLHRPEPTLLVFLAVIDVRQFVR